MLETSASMAFPVYYVDAFGIVCRCMHWHCKRPVRLITLPNLQPVQLLTLYSDILGSLHGGVELPISVTLVVAYVRE